MSRPTGRLVDVQLVEDDSAAPEASGPAPWRSVVAAMPPRVRSALVALVLAGALAVVGAGVAERAATSARLARTEGLSRSLAEPLVVAWRADGGAVLGVTARSVLVRTPSRAGDGVAALDLVSGDTLFTATGRCELTGAPASPGTAPPVGSRPRAAGDGDVLVCVGEPEPAGPGGGRVTTVRVHEPVGGDVVRTIGIADATTSFTLGADLVAVGRDARGHVLAGRWSLRSGERLWAYRSPDTPALDAGDDGGPRVGRTTGDDAVQVRVGTWQVSLDLDTGEPTGTATPAGRSLPWSPVPLADGGRAVAGAGVDGSAHITVHDDDGSTRFTTPGLLLPPAGVDDGTAEDTLFGVRFDDHGGADGGVLVAVDAATGRTRWGLDVAVGDRMVLSGVLVVADGARTTAVDARTGRTRWTSDAFGASGWTVVSDGRSVLSVVGARPTLVARDLLTGRVAWSVPAPVRATGLRQLPDGTVLAVGATQVVALRPPER